MPKNEGFIGIGVALNVNADTRPFKNLMTDLRRSGIYVVDQANVHITIVDSYETQFPIRSSRDQLALDNTRDAVGRYLSGLSLGLHYLTPESRRIESLGFRRSKVGMYIAEKEWLADIRSEIGEIFYQHARVNISSGRPYAGHITMGTRKKRSGGSAGGYTSRRMGNIRIPGIIHLNGFSITEKKDNEQKNQPKKMRRPHGSSKYRNVPASVRQV